MHPNLLLLLVVEPARKGKDKVDGAGARAGEKQEKDEDKDDEYVLGSGSSVVPG